MSMCRLCRGGHSKRWRCGDRKVRENYRHDWRGEPFLSQRNLLFSPSMMLRKLYACALGHNYSHSRTTRHCELEQKEGLGMRKTGIVTTYNCISTKLLIPCQNRLPSRRPRQPKPSSRRFRKQRRRELEVYPKPSLRPVHH